MRVGIAVRVRVRARVGIVARIRVRARARVRVGVGVWGSRTCSPDMCRVSSKMALSLPCSVATCRSFTLTCWAVALGSTMQSAGRPSRSSTSQTRYRLSTTCASLPKMSG